MRWCESGSGENGNELMCSVEDRIELVAEQLLACWEGLFSVTLVVLYCNDLTVVELRIYKAAAVLSVLMKVCTIPCHNRGHIYILLVLQSCTDPLHIMPGSSSKTFPSCNISNVNVMEDVDVKEEVFVAINEEVDIDTKQEEIPEDVTFPDINAEPDVVSYVCICLLLDTLYQCPEMSVIFVRSVVLATGNSSTVVNENVLL